MKIKALKGFKDILPEEIELWRYLEGVARDIFQRFQFREIRLPILEKTELFARSIGESTDIVAKEMYSFVDKEITMRPEATASLLRAYVEHGLYVQRPVQRLFTVGPMFRHERPQHGRLRQFNQMDVEVLGSDNPRIDAELMAMGAMLFDVLDINVSLELNSLGCPKCRPGYRSQLVSFVKDRLDLLCSDCNWRSTTNPLRVLDCKVSSCREQMHDAPAAQDHLCYRCAAHFKEVQIGLQQLSVRYRLNKFLVRGLDYYCRTAFEFITSDLGTQNAVAAGGRYDGLIEQIGGPRKSPGVGFAIGMERLVLLLQQRGKGVSEAGAVDLFVAGTGERATQVGFVLAGELRARKLSVAIDHEDRSLKSQMRQAHKVGARFVLIIGDAEIDLAKGILRNMKTEQQQDVALAGDTIAKCVSALRRH